MEKVQDAKEKIMEAAIELIETCSGDIESITTRAIAERAHVGTGLINYHFQTKEKLVELCVQRIIGNVISEFKPESAQVLKGADQLAEVAKRVADFLAENPAVSQISILGDYKSPGMFDNTVKTMKGFNTSLSGNDIPDPERTILLFTLVSVLQAFFLRRGTSAELLGFDFTQKGQRDSFIDLLVHQLFREGNHHE
jgi:AcrR family transcriptional regulator